MRTFVISATTVIIFAVMHSDFVNLGEFVVKFPKSFVMLDTVVWLSFLLRQLRGVVTDEVVKLSRVDYCNIVLFGLPAPRAEINSETASSPLQKVNSE